MSDLFGHSEPAAEFRDIRDQRAKVAEEKAILCHRLNTLLTRVPACVRNGSIQTVRQFQAEHKTALKTLKNTRASVPDLREAISTMERFQ